VQGAGQTGASAAGQRQRDGGRQLVQAAAAAAVADGAAGDLLGEGALGAGGGVAEQPADPQGEADLVVADGRVAQVPLLPAMDPGRAGAAGRAGSAVGRCACGHPDRAVVAVDALELHASQVREYCLKKVFARTGPYQRPTA
jgi:hypothetical protein